MRRPALAFVVGSLALLAACGGSPSEAPAAPVQTSPPAASSESPSTSAPSTAPLAAPSSASVPALASAAGAIKLTIAPNSTQVDVQMRELLAGNAAQTDAIESTKTVSGTVLLDAAGKVLPGSKITMDLTSLKSDRPTRDNFIKRVTL
ncbi:MAG TPA: hypothetical protein VF157_15365, partial [Chloroflexota bacterium]